MASTTNANILRILCLPNKAGTAVTQHVLAPVMIQQKDGSGNPETVQALDANNNPVTVTQNGVTEAVMVPLMAAAPASTSALGFVVDIPLPTTPAANAAAIAAGLASFKAANPKAFPAAPAPAA